MKKWKLLMIGNAGFFTGEIAARLHNEWSYAAITVGIAIQFLMMWRWFPEAQ